MAKDGQAKVLSNDELEQLLDAERQDHRWDRIGCQFAEMIDSSDKLNHL